MEESVIRRVENASASMDGLDPVANFYAHLVNSVEIVRKDVIVRTEQVVIGKRVVVNVFLDGVENTVRSHVPVDITDRNAKRLVNAKMERFVMQSVDIAHANQGGGGRSAIDHA